MVKIGADVHFVVASGTYKGHCRPGKVVRDWSRGQKTPGTVNLVVFLDGSNDKGADSTDPAARASWQTSAVYNPHRGPGEKYALASWHYAHECLDEQWVPDAPEAPAAPPAV